MNRHRAQRLAGGLGPALLYVAVAWPALRENSATYDETSQVAAGYSYVTRGDFRLNPEHPPLVKTLAALPLLSLDLTVSHEAERAFAAAARDPDARWIFGHRLLYVDNSPQPILSRARAVVLALGALLVVTVFCWARSAFGMAGGVFAATLAALDPNLLAHGTLATTDMGATLALFATFFFLRRALDALTPVHVAAAALAMAAAVASKHTALLLVLLLPAVGTLRLLDHTPWPRGGGRQIVGDRGRIAGLLTLFAVCAVTSWLGLWTAYGWRWSAFSDGSPHAQNTFTTSPARLPLGEWTTRIREQKTIRDFTLRGAELPDYDTFERLVTTRPEPLSERLIETLWRSRLLPEAYVFGLAVASAKAQLRWSYLLGQFSFEGFAAYFPVAFLLKTPLTTLALLLVLPVVGVLAFARGKSAGADPVAAARVRREAAYLVIPPVLIMAAATASRFNIGYRHILAVLPFLYALLGCLPAALAACLDARRARLAFASLVLIGAETLTVRPYFIPFFNVAAGGARGGLALLSDSNLDWGQALPALRRWMDAEGVERVNLCYFGTADPESYGVHYVGLAGTNVPNVVEVEGTESIARPEQQPELPGWVAISATHLQGTYLPPEIREHYAFLRDKQPAAVVGGAIYVYRVERWGE